MQKFLAVILLAIAALEGVVAAPVADTAAVDVRTNEKFPASPAFDGAEDIYGRDLADNEDEKQKRGEDPGAFPDVGQPLQVDTVAMDSGETGGRAEPGALDARSFEMDELEARDLEDRDNEPASEANADNGGGLEKRVSYPLHLCTSLLIGALCVNLTLCACDSNAAAVEEVDEAADEEAVEVVAEAVEIAVADVAAEAEVAEETEQRRQYQHLTQIIGWDGSSTDCMITMYGISLTRENPGKG
ncbi:hypothetical protein PG987_003147 [Apiospora arundinis]